MSPAPWNRNDIEKLCALGALLESRMEHEIDLLGHRMSWLVLFESLLAGAFTVALTSGKAAANFFVLIFVPILGMALVLSVYLSLQAATKVMLSLLEVRSGIDDQLKDLTPGKWVALGVARQPPLHCTVLFGDVLPIALMSWAIILFWALALLRIILWPV